MIFPAINLHFSWGFPSHVWWNRRIPSCKLTVRCGVYPPFEDHFPGAMRGFPLYVGIPGPPADRASLLHSPGPYSSTATSGPRQLGPASLDNQKVQPTWDEGGPWSLYMWSSGHLLPFANYAMIFKWLSNTSMIYLWNMIVFHSYVI